MRDSQSEGDRTNMDERPLPGPPWRSLFRGAVRESLAAANSVARIGTQDTHAWERPIRYVADDNQGNVGVVEFCADGAVAAMSGRAPAPSFDYALAIDHAPPGLRERLLRVCELPLLKSGLGVSAIFWTDGESIRGPQGGENAYLLGAEAFRRELLPDSAWETDGTAYYGLTPDVAHLATKIATRAKVGTPIVALSEHELRLLIPKGSAHESEALDLFVSDGLFELESSAIGRL
jgi:hypothetical protein